MPRPRFLVLSLSILLVPCVASLAQESSPPPDEKRRDVEFDGYTRAAELMVEKLFQSIRQVSTYSDDATMKMVTGMPMGQPEQPASFAFVRPGRFAVKNESYQIHGDGKQLMVYAVRMRRYTRSPADKDVAKQIKRYGSAGGAGFHVGALFLSRDPRAYFAEHFQNLDLTGRETLDDDPCYVLSGTTSTSRMGMGDAEVGATVWLRQSDSLIRRVELDLMEVIKAQFEESGGGMMLPFKEYKLVYDLPDMRLNQPVPEKRIAFKVPKGAKKVDRFYVADSGEGASQFERSGKPIPDFELETAGGAWIARSAVEDHVIVLDFVLPMLFGQAGTDRYEKLDELRRQYAADTVKVFCVFPDSSADKLVERFDEAGIELPILLDPDRTLTDFFFDERFASGLGIVGKDGKAQGIYRGGLDEQVTVSLRADIDKLLKGESLPTAEAMSDEQITEARDQRAARFSMGSAGEPINEDDLREAWSVHARGGQSFAFGGGAGAPGSSELWIRDKNSVRLISPQGQVTAELRIAKIASDMMGQDRFVAGRLGAQWGVVYMAPIAGDQEYMGYRPPKGAMLTAYDESGETLWELELESSGQQLPRFLTLTDIDGRRGDELLFVHQGALWIVDHEGEIIVRKPCTGNVQWLIVDDRDDDRRAEIYLRTQHKLQRFDYRAN